ncbi:U exon, partial [Pigeon adenovirus 1]
MSEGVEGEGGVCWVDLNGQWVFRFPNALDSRSVFRLRRRFRGASVESVGGAAVRIKRARPFTEAEKEELYWTLEYHQHKA